MAHGDYHCCAVCDRKLDYAGDDARTKEDVCTDCIRSVLAETGVLVTTGDELLAWITTAPVAAVGALDIRPCYYRNPVDDAVKAKLHPASA